MVCSRPGVQGGVCSASGRLYWAQLMGGGLSERHFPSRSETCPWEARPRHLALRGSGWEVDISSPNPSRVSQRETTVRVPSRAEQLVYGGEGRHLTWPDQEAQCKHEGSHLSRFSPSGSVCRALLAEAP